MKSLVEMIGQAVTRKQLTKAQGSSLLRHRQHHTEGHMLFMIKLMIEKHMTFSDAHKAAMKTLTLNEKASDWNINIKVGFI